jgi:ribosome production factor 1
LAFENLEKKVSSIYKTINILQLNVATMAPRDDAPIRSQKPKNKLRRQSTFLKVKKNKESTRRDERMKRKREEVRNPKLRSDRLAKNVPTTIDKKRVWDDVDVEGGDGIGISVDIEQFNKRRKTEAAGDTPAEDGALTEANLKQVEAQQEQAKEELVATIENEVAADDEEDGFQTEDEDDNESAEIDDEDDDLASLMDDSDDDEGEGDHDQKAAKDRKAMPPPALPGKRAASPTASTAASGTSTNLSLIPDALAAKFPTLFKPPEKPKILVTTSLSGTVHKEAELLCDFLPNSHYVPRQRHRYNSHHFSIREIAKFCVNRNYTALVIMGEDNKRPSSLTVVHLPEGPTFHFSISNWIEGKRLPGHGNPTEHYPELILNNFRTPLGLLTAHLFRALFPPQPELIGRQVVTLHNQRDYIFVRRHRYVFRDKRATEKQVLGADGKPIKGAEDLKAGLQELGPRFTLKLRRVDKGIQRGSGQEWEWKAGMEKVRTKFNL